MNIESDKAQIDASVDISNSMVLSIAVQLAQGWYSSNESIEGRKLPVARIVEDAANLASECGDFIVDQLREQVAAKVDEGVESGAYVADIEDENGEKIPVTQEQVDAAIKIDEDTDDSSEKPETTTASTAQDSTNSSESSGTQGASDAEKPSDESVETKTETVTT